MDAAYAFNGIWALQSIPEFVSIGGRGETRNIGHAQMNEMYLQVSLLTTAYLCWGRDYYASLNANPYATVGVVRKSSDEACGGTDTGQDRGYPPTDTSGNMAEREMECHRFDTGTIFGISWGCSKLPIRVEAEVASIFSRSR